MRAAAVIAVILPLTACSANMVGRTDGGIAAVPAPGTSVSRGALSADVRGGSAAAALLTLGAIAAVLHGAQPREAPLSEARRVHAQDCTQPIEDPGANLSCR